MRYSRIQNAIWKFCVGFITLFILVFLFTFSFADEMPFEFRKTEYRQVYHLCLIAGVPFCILLTLFRTLDADNSIWMNILIVLGTICGAYVIMYFVVIASFMYSFRGWQTMSIMYREKWDPAIAISDQIFDEGALGYGGRRTVKLEPILGLWYPVEEVDTNFIDNTTWTRVNEEGDMKFP